MSAAAGPGGIERRRSARRDPGELTEAVAVVGARLIDISHHGLQIEAPIPLALDSSMRLRLLIGGVRAEVGVRVATCRRRPVGRGRPWGVGVEFIEVPPEARVRITHALSTWRRSTRSA